MTPVWNALQPLLLLAFCLSSLSAQTNVLTYRNDNMRTAQNLAESVLTPANVKQGTFGKLLNLPVDGKVDAQPLVVSGLAIPGQGVHDVVFAVTEHDSAYAFDATTGAVLWQVSALKTGEMPSDNRGCGQVTPEIGITATPVIDLAAGPHGTIYLVAMSKTSTGSVYRQRLHALDLTTGAEQFNGPVDIQATYPGTGDNSSNGMVVFDPKQYKDRTALLLVNGVVYTSWASHCDIRPYTGWTIGYNQTTLAQTGVFNFTPNGNEAAIWGAGGGASADASGNLYFDLGNGTFDTSLNAGGFPSLGDFGNSFVKLTPSNGTLSAVDYWTMFNTVSESNADADLGSGGVMLLPDVLDAQGHVRHLGTGAGKDRNVYVFDRDNMGKFNPNNNGNIYQQLTTALSGGEFSSPAYFNGYVYYGSVGDVIRAFKVTAALLGSTPAFTSQTSFTYPGTSPSISANGNANGILWAVQNTTPAVLHAYDANDLVTEFYNSSQAGTRDQFGPGNKFITPTIANGKVFVGTQNSVAVFGNIGGAVLTNLSPSTGVQGSSVNITLTGTNFASGATVAVSGSGVTASNVSVVSATQITATLVIGAAAATGSYNVSVTTGGSTTNALPFTVTASSGGAPVLTSITPSSGAPGTSVNVTLAGSNFTPQSSVRLSGLGASVRNVVVVSATQITATFVLSSTTAAGQDNVFVVTAAGNSNIQPFTVTSSGSAPALTSITPNSGTQGTAVNVTLAGTNFASGATVAVSGSGVTASNVTVVSATQITATLTLSASAATGARNVSVTETAGTSNSVTFSVTGGAQAPTLTSVSPNSGAQGTAVNVTLAGTNFASGATVAVSGSGVTASNVTVVSATQITATLTVVASAATGARNVSVTKAAGTSNSVTFSVTSGAQAPTLTSITPNSGTQGTAVNVTLAGTNFTSGATVGVSGSGVTPLNVTVVSGTQITLTLTIAAGAPAGAYNLSVSTAGGTSNTASFTVNASGGSGPTITSLSPNSGMAGTSVQVTITGTNFTPQSSVRLAGLGAAVRNLVVVSPTQISVTFVLQPSTSTGPHNVFVVTSAGSSNVLPFTVN